MKTLLALALAVAAAVPLVAQSPQQVLDRAEADFVAGRVNEAVAGFDNMVKLVPLIAPQLWQRGVALFYAGRYADCRSQWEASLTVSPDDVENAAWHYLCVAKAESPAKARAALLRVSGDARVPMKEIYEMLGGRLQPDAVLKAAGNTPRGQFYAQFYTGLYYDANGDRMRALQALTAASADRFAQAGGFMHSAAKIHLAQLRTAR
jgi:lipoprotein NlpI